MRQEDASPKSTSDWPHPLLQRPHHLSLKIGIEQLSNGELSDLASDRLS